MKAFLCVLLLALVSGTARGQDAIYLALPDLPPEYVPPTPVITLAVLDAMTPVLDDDASEIIPGTYPDRGIEGVPTWNFPVPKALIQQLPREKQAELRALGSGDPVKFFRDNGVPVRRATSGYWQTRCVNGNCTQTWVDSSGRQTVTRYSTTAKKKAPTTTRRRLLWRRR